MAESVDTMKKMSMPARTPEQIEKTIHTGVAEIAYLDEGPQTGTPIIFLHGFPDDPKTWDSVIDEIRHENFRLLRPWQRGAGRSRIMDQAASGAQVAALAQDVLDFADGLALRRFFLVGHDWGSRAAHGVAALAPERVIGLVALATGYGSGTPSEEVKLRQEQAFWYQWFFQTPHGRQTFEKDPKTFCEYLWRTWSPEWRFTREEYEVAARSFSNPQFVETVLHYYSHRWKSAEGRTVYARQQEILDASPPILAPTIFVCGAADSCNLAEFSRGNERFYDSSYRRVEIPGVGHFPQRETPGLIAQIVRELVQLASVAVTWSK